MIEIDGVTQSLERPVSSSGDFIADMYLRAIDLSTAPKPLGERGMADLASALRRLNRHLATTSFYLSGTGCEETYNDVVAQLNEMNYASPGLEPLKPLMSIDDAKGSWSPRIISAWDRV